MPMDDRVKVHLHYIGEPNPMIVDTDYIKVFMERSSKMSMIVRFYDRHPRWLIKSHRLGAELKIVNSKIYEESTPAFKEVSKELFLEYLESTNKMDYEWVLWNLEVLDGKYYAASEGQRLNNLSNDG